MTCVTCNEPIADGEQWPELNGFQCQLCWEAQCAAGWHEIMNDNADKTKGTK